MNSEAETYPLPLRLENEPVPLNWVLASNATESIISLLNPLSFSGVIN